MVIHHSKNNPAMVSARITHSQAPLPTARGEGKRVAPSALDSAAFVWDRIREHLEDERYRISREMVQYPTPIPACDQDFNHLLAEREQVNEELARLELYSTRSLAAADPFAIMDQFIRSSPCIPPALGDRFLAR